MSREKESTASAHGRLLVVAAADAGVPGIFKKVAGISPAKMAVKVTPIIMAKPALAFSI